MPTYKVEFVKTYRCSDMITVTAANEDSAHRVAHDLLVTNDIRTEDGLEFHFDDADVVAVYEDTGVNDEEWMRQSAETLRKIT